VNVGILGRFASSSLHWDYASALLLLHTLPLLGLLSLSSRDQLGCQAQLVGPACHGPWHCLLAEVCCQLVATTACVLCFTQAAFRRPLVLALSIQLGLNTPLPGQPSQSSSEPLAVARSCEKDWLRRFG
jgi:hypothetical protein